MSKITAPIALALLTSIVSTLLWLVYTHVLRDALSWPCISWINFYLLYVASKVWQGKISVSPQS